MLTTVATWAGVIASVAGIVAIIVRYFWSNRERETGKLEARNEGLELELEKERSRAEIESRNSTLTPDDLERLL